MPNIRGTPQTIRCILLIWVCLCLLVAPGLPASGETGEDPRGPAPEPGELMPLEKRTKTFRLIEGDRRGELLQLNLAPVGGESGQWRLQLGEDQVLFLRPGAKGGLFLTRIKVLDENRSILYTEPLPILPERFTSRSTYVKKTHVHIYDLETGKLQRSGPVVHEIEKISRTRFNVGAGRFSGYLIDIRQVIDLRGATVRAQVEIGFVPGRGIVKGRGKFITEKMLFFDDVDIVAGEWDAP